LLYVADNGNIAGTIRIVKSGEQKPMLPILEYCFRYNGGYVCLERLFDDGRLEKIREAESQVGGLALGERYRANNSGLFILFKLFYECLRIAKEEEIKNALICSRPRQTSLYEKVGAEILLRDACFRFSSRKGEYDKPADVLHISTDNLMERLSVLKNRFFS